MSDNIECFNCARESRQDSSIRENIWVSDHWRVAHAFNSSLPGWLVVVATRHVEAMDELSEEESAEFGRLLRDVSSALKSVTRCAKTYVMLFAEMPGFHHLHVHVVPRMSDLPEDRRGSAVFAYLKEDPLSIAELDAISLQLREVLSVR